ncbi:MAG: IclR family transcriptional regulator [Clostridia bacterium]|nr:IclR family transcriptional regulator [Clostridia bacterium]
MENKGDTVRSVEKAMDLLLAFSEEKTQLSLPEICAIMNMPKSTVYRLLSTLEKRRFIEHNKLSGKYQLGVPFLRLANIVLKNFDLREIALPVMIELRDLTGETINLYLKRGLERVCIEQAEGIHNLRRFSNIGDVLPLYCGASGKLLLAYQTEDEIEKVIKNGLRAWTQNTITDITTFREELKIIREKGYAYSHGEREIGVTSVAAPIKNHNGMVIAALSISGPDARFNDENLLNYTKLVINGAAKISENLGYIK